MCEVLMMGLKERDKEEAKGASKGDRKGNIKVKNKTRSIRCSRSIEKEEGMNNTFREIKDEI